MVQPPIPAHAQRGLIIRAAFAPAPAAFWATTLAAIIATVWFGVNLPWLGVLIAMTIPPLVFTGLGLTVFDWARRRFGWSKLEARYQAAAAPGMLVVGGLGVLGVAAAAFHAILVMPGPASFAVVALAVVASAAVSAAMLYTRIVEVPRLRRLLGEQDRPALTGSADTQEHEGVAPQSLRGEPGQRSAIE